MAWATPSHGPEGSDSALDHWARGTERRRAPRVQSAAAGSGLSRQNARSLRGARPPPTRSALQPRLGVAAVRGEPGGAAPGDALSPRPEGAGGGRGEDAPGCGAAVRSHHWWVRRRRAPSPGDAPGPSGAAAAGPCRSVAGWPRLCVCVCTRACCVCACVGVRKEVFRCIECLRHNLLFYYLVRRNPRSTGRISNPAL